jgi:hypothetical protein
VNTTTTAALISIRIVDSFATACFHPSRFPSLLYWKTDAAAGTGQKNGKIGNFGLVGKPYDYVGQQRTTVQLCVHETQSAHARNGNEGQYSLFFERA